MCSKLECFSLGLRQAESYTTKTFVLSLCAWLCMTILKPCYKNVYSKLEYLVVYDNLEAVLQKGVYKARVFFAHC